MRRSFLAEPNARTKPADAIADPPAADPAAAAFLAGIGAEVRRHRAKRGMTRRQLASASATSERYLAQIESGGGNPSVSVLRAIAQALDLPCAALIAQAGARTAALGAVFDLLAQVPETELPALTKELAARVAQCGGADRARRVEEEYGASIPDLIEMAGTATFRRHERRALDRVIAEHDAAVITTAGGIVADPETYALLLRRSHAVWIKAQPEDHMSRVMAQGDFRPMAQNRGANPSGAMADLMAILDARHGDYARAEAELDTSGETVEQSFAKLLRIVAPWLEGQWLKGRWLEGRPDGRP
jgi:XRE family aerobic/anaerobic benzoate catabolism transcriptional regulator